MPKTALNNKELAKNLLEDLPVKYKQLPGIRLKKLLMYAESYLHNLDKLSAWTIMRENNNFITGSLVRETYDSNKLIDRKIISECILNIEAWRELTLQEKDLGIETSISIGHKERLPLGLLYLHYNLES